VSPSSSASESPEPLKEETFEAIVVDGVQQSAEASCRAQCNEGVGGQCVRVARNIGDTEGWVCSCFSKYYGEFF
jgi:hypothetical protein